MYEIRALVGERHYLETVSAGDVGFCIVDLELWPFALLPLDESGLKAASRLWTSVLPDFGSPGGLYRDGARALLRGATAPAPDAALAFVDAEFFGGAGQGVATAIARGEITVFDEPDDAWPDTNISMALKSIGVPERLDRHQDAFDVLGLGRIRRTEAWRKR